MQKVSKQSSGGGDQENINTRGRRLLFMWMTIVQSKHH